MVLDFREVVEWVDPEIGLEERHAQTPNVDLLVVLLSLLEQHLRRKVKRGANQPLPHRPALQRPEICNLIGLFHTDDVFRFDIPMYIALVMDSHQPSRCIQTNIQKFPEVDMSIEFNESPKGTGPKLK